MAAGAGAEEALESCLKLCPMVKPIAAKFLKASMIACGTETSVGIPSDIDKAVMFLTPYWNELTISSCPILIMSIPKTWPSS